MWALVTGGGGLVGSRIVRRLLASGRDVVSLDQTAAQPRLDDLGGDGRLERVACDIREAEALTGIVRDRRVDRIVHMAALLAPVTEDEPALGLSANVMGAANVFEAARHGGARRVIYATSIATYGDQAEYGEGTTVDEASPRHPYNLYGYAKLMNEETAKAYARNFGLETCGLRIAAVFGHGRVTGRSSAISRIISAAAVGEPVVSDVAAEQPAPVIYVDDVAEIMTRLCLADRLAAPIYCGPSTVVTVADAVAAVRGHIPDAEVAYAPDAAAYATVLHMDAGRFAKDIGYAPPPFEARVRDQINEARAERQLPPV